MKVILVTGASSGIGRATAECFARAGWRVGAMARRTEMLEELAAAHDSVIPLPGDVTDEVQVEAAFDSFVDKAGRIDALFNNAGKFGTQASIDQISLEDWQGVVNLNLTGMFLAARAAFRRMRAQDPQGGRIINNGSLSAHSPREGSVSYTSTKHAISGLTKSISLDGRPFDIACGQIDIGNARTEMVDSLNRKLEAAGKPLMPMMQAEEAAEAVLHMANLPLSTNVQTITIMATKMPYVGRG